MPTLHQQIQSNFSNIVRVLDQNDVRADFYALPRVA